MVSSTVGGQEDRLEQVRNVLTTLGYRVWMSKRNTFPINPALNTLQNCLAAVDAAHIVLILIDRRYGTVSADSVDGLSVFHEEVRRAVDGEKPRFVFVHNDVHVARRLLAQFNTGAAGTPWAIPGFVPVAGLLDDLRVLNVYDYALQEHLPEDDRHNWVQPFQDLDSLLEAIHAQFEDRDRIAGLI